MNNTKNSKITFLYSKEEQRNSMTETQPGLGATSRLSYRSSYSQAESSSSYSVRRINELAPKQKISIKEQKQVYTKTKERDKFNLRSIVQQLGLQKETQFNSISYKQIKPVLGFQKYVNLCGIERGNSSKGCSCLNCKWRKLWTKNYSPKNLKLYQDLRKQQPDSKNLQQITKDIYRTYPDCPTFNKNQQFALKLKQLLVVYSIYDPQVGYAQGMNMVAAVLLYHIKDTEKTFWAFVDLMDDQQLRMIYFGQFQYLKKHCSILKQLIIKKIRDLNSHMEELGVIPDVFFYGWLLSLMSNCIPLQYMHLVVDKFRNKGWNFIYKLIITYLIFIKQKLLLSEDTSQFLINIANDSSKQIGMHWQQMIQNCHKIQF